MWAQMQNLQIGGGADTWIKQRENEQRQAIEQGFHLELLKQQEEAADQMAEIQQQAAAQAARISTAAPTGVGGAASIRGSRLNITESGRGRRGTKAFSRPTQYLNTLGIGGGGGTASRSSTVTL